MLDLIDDPDAEPQSVVHWLTTAVQTRRTTPQRILKAASSRRFLRHRRLLETLALDVAAGARSPLELDFLRLVERPHGLPVGHRQASRGTEVDPLYKEYRLLVELDGRLGHDGVARFRDMRRDNWATADGLATLRYGFGDVHGIPCEVATQVAAILGLRGWTGPAHRCQNCRWAA